MEMDLKLFEVYWCYEDDGDNVEVDEVNAECEEEAGEIIQIRYGNRYLDFEDIEIKSTSQV